MNIKVTPTNDNEAPTLSRAMTMSICSWERESEVALATGAPWLSPILVGRLNMEVGLGPLMSVRWSGRVDESTSRLCEMVSMGVFSALHAKTHNEQSGRRTWNRMLEAEMQAGWSRFEGP